jgi:hypothetical protein
MRRPVNFPIWSKMLPLIYNQGIRKDLFQKTMMSVLMLSRWQFSPRTPLFHPLKKNRSKFAFVEFSSSTSADSEETNTIRTLSDSEAIQYKPRYLMVPFSEKDEVKRLGARWDPRIKRWFDPSPGNAQLDKWYIPARKYLAVPFNENEEAKSSGAKWDNVAKLWYDPSSNSPALDRWNVNNTAILELHGEDRNFGGSDLIVDLIPKSCWFTNVRYCVHPSDWERLRRHVYARAGSRCECCGSHTPKPEAHERWRFDAARRVQKLVRLIALCRSCHEATHMGLAELRGRGDAAAAHLRQVRGFSEQEAEAHISDAFRLWSERSSIEWELDLSVITDSGIRLAREVDAGGRSQVARAALAAAEPLGRAAPPAPPRRGGGAAAASPRRGVADDSPEQREQRDGSGAAR